MDRLTTQMANGKWIVLGNQQAAIDRLAAYEDTGLEPDTVSKIRDVVLDIHGDIGHLRELVQAKKDGRLVVLPCYTGEKVYMLLLGKILELEVGSITLNGDITKIQYYSSSICSSPEDFGKTVFLNREEAEAALKGGMAEMAMLYGTLDEIIDLCDDIPAGAEPPEKEPHNG